MVDTLSSTLWGIFPGSFSANSLKCAMPKSFLIRKRANSTQGHCMNNYVPDWDKKGTPPEDGVQPYSALSDDNKIIEPLDLIVARVKEEGKEAGQYLEGIHILEDDTGEFPDGGCVMLDGSTSDDTGSCLPDDSPELIAGVPGFEYDHFSLSPTGYEGRHHDYCDEDERHLPSFPDSPGAGYFSRCLQMACKLQGSRILDGRKRNQCAFCTKGFNDKFDLKRHIRTHTGVRPFKCDQCFRAFTQRCSLEVHQRKVHNMELKFAFKQRRGKVYICEDCGHSTNDINEHYVHSVRVHRRPYVAKPPDAPVGRGGDGAGIITAPTVRVGLMQEFNQPVPLFAETGRLPGPKGGTGLMSGMYY